MPASSADWLAFARADLDAARLLAAEQHLPGRIACFHAQQSVEKALKAALVHASIPFRKTHDIVVLAGLPETALAKELADVDLPELQSWAVDGRYPGDLPDATAYETRKALTIAEDVYTIVTRWIGGQKASESAEAPNSG